MGNQRPQVTVPVLLQLIEPADTEMAISATFRYDPNDPYAVEIVFDENSSGGNPISWKLARDLLVTALNEPAGLGDVRLWPLNSSGDETIALALSSPEGRALFGIPRHRLVYFLRRSFGVVPRGREGDYLDIDTTVTRLLNGR
ncbi:MAG TPA: SsgA family sporulation/cell division regulator [Candidatus Saccharimonadales bacterium]|nr:SsgA family sporulation/cell division regulator [Candidatus Saccharimonadales bacterium]